MRGENLTSKAPKFIRLLAIYLHKNVIGLSEADGTILNAPILLKIPGTVGWARTTDLLFHSQTFLLLMAAHPYSSFRLKNFSVQWLRGNMLSISAHS
jgi:hypothetical protein